ncbi:PadR family transcriptional regulator [Actinomycetaceae bacterium TAE3-ERU4]|nr:PadR family transcriptional regulator [Actinomycetaceae bacterium TAE3-ERU4]
MSSKFSDWQRTTLPLLLLREMSISPAHGYALSARLEERGFERVKGAQLYPALTKLETQGYCESTWLEGEGGPGRKSYCLTSKGEEYLGELELEWERFTTAYSTFFKA